MTVQMVMRHRGHPAVFGLQHFRAICADATFLPTECLTAPASYLPRPGNGWNGPHATPRSPFLMPLGGPGSRLSPVSIPQHGTGDSDGKARLLETFNKEIARTPSKLTGEHAIPERHDQAQSYGATAVTRSPPH
jgi:hypothetical protein